VILDLLTLAGVAAPWLALGFGVSAAFVADTAFRSTTAAEPPDPIYGQTLVLPDDLVAEIEQSGVREGSRNKAAAQQRAATLLATAAAVEAAAGAAHGASTAIIALIGLTIGVVPPARRWWRGQQDARKARAWAVHAAFEVKNKHLYWQQGDGDAVFIREHPAEAKILGITPRADDDEPNGGPPEGVILVRGPDD
jgi:hypothetical protein